MEHPRTTGRALALARAAHGGPALAVTVVAGLLATTAGLSATETVLVVAAVLTGQLSIGWSNDLVDCAATGRCGRTDKPLATGELPASWSGRPALLALVATVLAVLRLRARRRPRAAPRRRRPAGPTTSGSRRRRSPGCPTPWPSAPCPVFVAVAGQRHRPAGVGARGGRAARGRRPPRQRAARPRRRPRDRGPRAAAPARRPLDRALAAAVLVAASLLICVAASLTRHWAHLGRARRRRRAGRRRGHRSAAHAVPGGDGHRSRRRRPAGGLAVTDDTWDLVVVGAGPAGCATALGALDADPGLRVLLLDRADFPRDKSCGDGIAPHVFDVLRTRRASHDVADGWTPLRRLELDRGDPTVERAAWPRPVWVIPRAVFDARLVEHADGRRRGAACGTGSARSPARRGGRVVDGRTAAACVVGADGAHSVVRRPRPDAARRRRALAHPWLRPDARRPGAGAS